MKIWHISDTHTYHSRLNVPDGIDLVIHSGDESTSRNSQENWKQCVSFLDWFGNLPIPEKIFVAGNHSMAIYRGIVNKGMIEGYGIKYLQDSSITIDGLKIYGSPYTPLYNDWAFMLGRGKIEKVWNAIDDDTNILVTHGPPFGKLDITKNLDNSLYRGGCKALLNKVRTLGISHHLYGHFHSEKDIDNYGALHQEDICFMNSACHNLNGDFYNGQTFDI